MMGVSGSGKTTIGQLVATQLHVPFTDADGLHSAANVRKMTNGIPLDDDDRLPWLARVSAALADAPAGIVVACSALKRSYRDLIRQGCPEAAFVHLDGSRNVLERRLGARGGHFMPSSLLDSQLQTLESLAIDEHGWTIDNSCPATLIADRVVELVSGTAVGATSEERGRP